MNLTNEFQPIRDWAKERGLYEKGDLKTQTLKLQEEVGELSKAVIEMKGHDIVDAIGDCVVVLTNLAKIIDLDIEVCINTAFNEIRNRKGKTENGTFIREK